MNDGANLDPQTVNHWLKDLLACQSHLAAAVVALIAASPEKSEIKRYYKEAMDLVPKVKTPPGTVLETTDAIRALLDRAFRI